jgi:hypothetical protein
VADRIQLIGAPRRAEYSDAADSPPEAAPVTVPASPVEKAPDAADEDDLPF